MKYFWKGFCKQADVGAGDGGKGFGSVGKGNYHSQREQNEVMGTEDTGVQDSKQLLSRERNPGSFNPFETGVAMEDESGTHIIY